MTSKKISVTAKPKRVAYAQKKGQYDNDFFSWTKTQANLLKKRALDQLDIDNLIEEIQSLGRSDKRALISHTVVLLTHMLKLKYHPKGKGNSNSWNSSVLNATREIKLLLKDSPSLKKELIKALPEAYEDARKFASFKCKLDIKTFPLECPWEMDEILPKSFS